MRGRRSTPEGQHRPVLLDEVLKVLDPQPGETVKAGDVIAEIEAPDLDQQLLQARADLVSQQSSARLSEVGCPFALHAGNFAGLPAILAREGVSAVQMLVADLGMSSMQVDDPERGFSYRRDGPLDMRMDRTRGQTAADILANMDQEELSKAIRDLGDEENAERIAEAIASVRRVRPLLRTTELARLIMEATQGKSAVSRWQLHPSRNRWNLHPAARTFQALRMLVNRELPNLEQLLRMLPQGLAPGGRAAIISFHSGEDRLVKAAFRAGFRAGLYAQVSDNPIRAGWQERNCNPRSRSAKLRWARRPTN